MVEDKPGEVKKDKQGEVKYNELDLRRTGKSMVRQMILKHNKVVVNI